MKRLLLSASLLIAACAGAGPAAVVAPRDAAPPAAVRAAPTVVLQLASSVGDALCEDSRAFTAEDKPYCLIDEELSWHEASRRCQSLGGHLADFETRSEQLAVERAVRSPLSANSLWIGLTRGRGEWQWAGEPLTYQGWAAGEPNNSGGQEQCGEWLRGDGRFNDLPCDQRRGALCEAGPDGGRCGGERLVTEAGEYCVYATTQLSWSEASALCAETGLQLATLSSEHEAERLADALASRLRSSRVWLGLSDEAEEGNWRWSDGTAVASSAAVWGQGQPDNYNAEHCGEWRLDSGDWNDMRCDSPRAALCEFEPERWQASSKQNEATANSEEGGRLSRAN